MTAKNQPIEKQMLKLAEEKIHEAHVMIEMVRLYYINERYPMENGSEAYINCKCKSEKLGDVTDNLTSALEKIDSF